MTAVEHAKLGSVDAPREPAAVRERGCRVVTAVPDAHGNGDRSWVETPRLGVGDRVVEPSFTGNHHGFSHRVRDMAFDPWMRSEDVAVRLRHLRCVDLQRGPRVDKDALSLRLHLEQLGRPVDIEVLGRGGVRRGQTTGEVELFRIDRGRS